MGELVVLRMTVEPDASADAEELDEMTGGLRRRLQELDLADVERVRGDGRPDGAKSAETFSLAALSVTLAPTMLTAVVALVKDWLAHRPVRSVRIVLDGDELELSGTSPDEQRQLVDLFVRRHTPGPA